LIDTLKSGRDSKPSAPAARVPFDLLWGRSDRFLSDDLEASAMTTSADRDLRGAETIPGFPPHELFDDSIL